MKFGLIKFLTFKINLDSIKLNTSTTSISRDENYEKDI